MRGYASTVTWIDTQAHTYATHGPSIVPPYHAAAYAGGAESVSIGPMAWASGDNSVAIGNTGDTDNTRRELLGKDATRRLNPGLSVTASGQHSVAIGSYPQATGNYSIALGECESCFRRVGVEPEFWVISRELTQNKTAL